MHDATYEIMAAESSSDVIIATLKETGSSELGAWYRV
jgi:hypothetical protein